MASLGIGPGQILGTCGPSDSYSTYAYDTYSNGPDTSLNIFIITSENAPWSGCAPAYLSEDFNFIFLDDVFRRYVISYEGGNESTGRYEEGLVLVHELGHALGLGHTYGWGFCNQCNNFPDINCPDTGPGNCNPAHPISCSNNIMGRATISSRRFLSPLQIAHTRRITMGTWRSKLFEMSYDNSLSIIISESTVWEYGKLVYGDVTVQSGDTLEIRCVVFMAPGSKISVEKGAVLIIDGGQLTVPGSQNTSRYWKGIEVNGDQTKSQTAANQGVVELNNAIIEYANEAIYTGKFGITYQGGGAIVQADNSTFRNNRRSIAFLQYDLSDNLSYFNNCQFILNEDYPQSDYIDMFTAWNVYGIDITDCAFSNTSSVSDKKHAIFTIDAGYSVLDNCSFEGFDYGVYGTNSSTTNFFIVDEAAFDDNALCVYAGAVDDVIITSNTMIVGNHETNFYNHGIFIDESTGFQIENNTLTGNDIIAGSPRPYGIECFSVGNDYNQIYRNNLSGFYIGNLAEGDNRNETTFTGLEWICNENDNNDYDFAAIIDDNFDDDVSGIKDDQGSTSESAGNTFTLSGLFGRDFYNNTDWDVDYWYDNGTDKDPDDLYNAFDFLASSANSCSSGLMMLTSSGDPSQYFSEESYFEHQEMYTQKLAIYENLIDGGNTIQLLHSVQSVDSESASNILSELMDISPWVSKTVMIEILKEKQFFTSQELVSLLNSNPDLLRSKSVRSLIAITLDEKDQLKVYQNLNNLMSDRTLLKVQIGNHFTMMNVISDHFIDDLLESGNKDYVPLRLWLDRKGTIQSAYRIVESFIEEGDQTNALIKLMSIEKDFEMNTIEVQEYNAYKAITKLKLDALTTNRSIAEFTEMEVQNLLDIADSFNGRASVQARGILNFFYGFDFQHQPNIIDENTSEIRGLQFNKPNNEDLLKESQRLVKITPNPSNGDIRIMYDLGSLTGNIQHSLEIIDQFGAIVKSFKLDFSQDAFQWSFPELHSGMYYYVLRKEGNSIEIGKILIQR